MHNHHCQLNLDILILVMAYSFTDVGLAPERDFGRIRRFFQMFKNSTSDHIFRIVAPRIEVVENWPFRLFQPRKRCYRLLPNAKGAREKWIEDKESN